MAVAQLVESRIVIPVVVGSSPISHPNKINNLAQLTRLGFFVSNPLTDYLQTAVHGFVPCSHYEPAPANATYQRQLLELLAFRNSHGNS